MVVLDEGLFRGSRKRNINDIMKFFLPSLKDFQCRIIAITEIKLQQTICFFEKSDRHNFSYLFVEKRIVTVIGRYV